MKYDIVVGLEVHIQLNTASKAFCGDANVFGDQPNTNISAITLAHPGTLPVANKLHIDKAIQLGLALGCEINEYNFFDRKHYFYPDLPKGYQITQDHQPICIGGSLAIEAEGQSKPVTIHHIHMEEDAGKNVHDQHPSLSLLDLNRAGTPLLELVTDPCLSSGEEVYVFMAALQRLLRYIDISDADMEKGSMRCDCNVSVKPAGASTLGERCEIKNLNSKRFAREAVNAEAQRQISLIEAGGLVVNTTMSYDTSKGITIPMRAKEGVADYRYLPDPDLPPLHIDQDHIDRLRLAMPELPWVIKKRWQADLGLTEDYAEQLTQSPEIVRRFTHLSKTIDDPRLAANFLINQWLPTTSKASGSPSITEDNIVAYLRLISDGHVSASIASQQLWPAIVERPQVDPAVLAAEIGVLIQQDDNLLQELIHTTLAAHPAQVKQYRSGKKALFGFFVGAIMRASGGSVDPQQLKEKLLAHLDQRPES